MNEKSEKLYEGITQIGDDLIEEAQDVKYIPKSVRRKEKFRKYRYYYRAAAAVIILAVVLNFVLSRTSLSAYAIEQAKYPKERQWDPDAVSASNFLKQSIPVLLSGTEGENIVCSPANIYLMLSMLAEVTEGNTRAEVLSLLDTPDMDTQREKATRLWNRNFSNDSHSKVILASSLWMDHDITYNEDTMKILAQDYYASSFQGEMGSSGLKKACRKWLEEQTGGKFGENLKEAELEADTTVLAMISTIYFTSNWGSQFKTSDTKTGTFHGASGDVDADFMKQTLKNSLYTWGDHFSVVSQNFETDQAMFYILPDEGYTPEDLLSDPGFQDYISREGAGWTPDDQSKSMIVHLSVPKFDVSSEIDLLSKLKELGINDALDYKRSDYSPLSDLDEVYLDEASNNVRVTINEKGCEAVSYVKFGLKNQSDAPAEDEIDFTLDRPFIFMVKGYDCPLLIGIVNQP